MGTSSGIIDSTVRMRADVRTLLGETVNTLSGLCTSSKINPWAKYKPVRWSGTTRASNWWQGSASTHRCGFVIPTYATASDITANAMSDAWDYQRPNGGTYPYRLYDFSGYNHNAAVTFNALVPTRAVYSNGSCNGVVKFQIFTASTNGLAMTDIFNGTFYWGVAVGGYVKTSSSAISSGGTTISLDGCPKITGTGTYLVAAVITSYKQTTWGAFERICYNLQAPNIEGDSIVNCQVVATVADGYAIGFSGLDTADKTCWIKSGNASMSGGRFSCAGTIKRKYTKSYTLVSVTARAVRNSDSYTVTNTVTAANLSYVSPGDIDKVDYLVNDSVTFACTNINPSSLPKDAGDYYLITYIFNYSAV